MHGFGITIWLSLPQIMSLLIASCIWKGNFLNNNHHELFFYIFYCCMLFTYLLKVWNSFNYHYTYHILLISDCPGMPGSQVLWSTTSSRPGYYISCWEGHRQACWSMHTGIYTVEGMWNKKLIDFEQVCLIHLDPSSFTFVQDTILKTVVNKNRLHQSTFVMVPQNMWYFLKAFPCQQDIEERRNLQ